MNGMQKSSKDDSFCQGRAGCREKKGISDARRFINSRNFLSYQLVQFSIEFSCAYKKLLTVVISICLLNYSRIDSRCFLQSFLSVDKIWSDQK